MSEATASMYASVPVELKILPNWVGWKLETRADNKPTKIPYSATGVLASSTDKTTWRTFDDVKVIPSMGTMGIGFVFDGNGIVGIDLDHCLNGGILDSKFTEITTRLKTYTEISPSGTGLHLFIRCAEKPYDKGHKKEDVEIYSEGRYFTVTGNKWGDCPDKIVEYPAELVRELLDPFLSIPTPKEYKPVSTTTDLSDEDIYNIISYSANAHKFNQLMNGSIAEYANDRSRADMALASILAFYTSDANQIERIMRQSGLVRDKWDKHARYLSEMTIQKSISMCTSHYEPTMALDYAHGGEVAKAILGNSPAVRMPQQPIEELSTKEIQGIREAIQLCENLPPFPQISHPLFKKWMTVGKRLMYSHPSYHFGNLLPITSMALGRRVCVLISTKHTYTNFNMMLVGTSTISGKSFSSDTAIQEFGMPVVSIQAPVNPEDNSILKRKSCSNPRLVQDLSDTYNMLWYYDEAKEFFDEAGERGWNAPIVGNLCTAYDGSPLEVARSNKRRRRDDEEEDNMWRCPTPFLNLLFNMTITQLKEASTSKIVGSGFFYRWVWFIENGGEKKPNVTASDEDVRCVEEIRQELVGVGLRLKQLPPDSIVFSVNKKIEDWSMEISKRSTEENYQAATGRSVMHVYKMAMIFSLFDPEFQCKVFDQPQYPIRVSLPEKWVDEAINIVENYLLPRMMTVIEYSEKVEQSNRQEWVLSKLRDSGGVLGHSELLKKTKLDATEFTKAIRTLLESEEIKTTKEGTKIIYYLVV